MRLNSRLYGLHRRTHPVLCKPKFWESVIARGHAGGTVCLRVGKIKLFLCAPWRHNRMWVVVMKDANVHSPITSAQNGVKCSGSRSDRFTPQGTYWLQEFGEEKYPSLLRRSRHHSFYGCPVSRPVLALRACQSDTRTAAPILAPLRGQDEHKIW